MYKYSAHNTLNGAYHFVFVAPLLNRTLPVLSLLPTFPFLSCFFASPFLLFLSLLHVILLLIFSFCAHTCSFSLSLCHVLFLFMFKCMQVLLRFFHSLLRLQKEAETAEKLKNEMRQISDTAVNLQTNLQVCSALLQ